MYCQSAGFSFRIVAGEQCKVAGELQCIMKERNLAGEFCVVAGEFADL